MNREEFDELRSEFAEYIYRYENFLKNGYLNDLFYTFVFKDLLEPNAKLEFENQVMFALNKEKEANKDFDPTDILNASRENQKSLFDTIKRKNILAEETYNRVKGMVPEDIRNIETRYLQIVKKYHPVVRVFVSEDEKIVFNKLREFYNSNQMGAFDEILNLNVNLFQDIDYKPEQYSNVAGFFYENQKRINADYTKKANTYPFNTSEILKDEISVAREKGELKSKHTKLLRDNQEFKKRFKELYNVDFQL